MATNVGEVTGPRHGRAPAGPSKQPSRRSVRVGRLDLRLSPYLFVAPFFVLFAVFGAYPLIYTAILSTRKNTLTGGDKGFVGLENYRKILWDEHFWVVIGNTFGLFVVATVPQLIFALLVASWLNKKMRARTAIRMGVLIPNITSVAAVGIVFGLIFADRYGLANWALQSLHLDPVEWRNHRWSSWTAIAFMVDWRWTGYNALIYLAAMQAIPKEHYESASLDGASAARRFWRITVPLIQPTILFTVIISTIRRRMRGAGSGSDSGRARSMVDIRFLSVGRADPANDQHVQQRHDEDEDEDHPGDGAGIAELESGEAVFDQVHGHGLELPQRPALDRSRARGEEQRFGEKLDTADDGDDRREDQRGPQQWQRHREELPGTGGAVDLGCLVQVGRDRLHGGQEDQGVVAGPAPVDHQRDR